VILLDTSVMLDLLRDDQEWAQWSAAAADAAAASDRLFINQIIYAELSSQYDNIEQLDRALTGLDVAIADMPRASLFLAGAAFRKYRKVGGTKSNVLSDFFIGAHAAIENATLLTRDPKRIRGYFPTVTLVSP
jgi:predicted nucleic acid-binding protein